MCCDCPGTNKFMLAINEHETLGYSTLSLLSYYLTVSYFKREIFFYRPRWQKVVALTLWPVPEAAVTVWCIPDDGCDRHPK